MTLLAVERIKLFSTRSPWWCMGLTLVLGLGLGALLSGVGDAETLTIPQTQAGTSIGLYVIMVMAAIAVTTEYRFGTIRVTFAAVPNRIAALSAKTVFVTFLAGLVGLVTAFASWGLASVIASDADLAISTEGDYRATLGYGLLFAAYAVMALGVGTLVRQTAGAVSLLLVWALVVESIAGILDATLDTAISPWMPFANAGNFVTAGDEVTSGAAFGSGVEYPFGGPWGSLAYFSAVALVLLVTSMIVANRRDA